jgi:hypothetical protein
MDYASWKAKLEKTITGNYWAFFIWAANKPAIMALQSRLKQDKSLRI